MLAPAAFTCCSIDCRAPVPIATMTITTATPIVMPSSVSAERSLLRPRALQRQLQARLNRRHITRTAARRSDRAARPGAPDTDRTPTPTAAGDADRQDNRARRSPSPTSAAPDARRSAATSSTTTPMRPPARLSVTASARNCSSTSRARAPSAMRRPISRVRSVTDSSMMFMIPMPPTSSDMPATLASSAVIVRLDRSSVADNCSSVTSSRPGTLPAMARATCWFRPLPSATRGLRADDEVVRRRLADTDAAGAAAR